MKNHIVLELLYNAYAILIFTGRKRIQYVIPKHFLQRIIPFSIISIEILCANAVIDTFITSKGFNFLFNHITVWIAFSIESNNERPLPHAKGWAAATCFYESVSNNFSCCTFVLSKRGPSNRFIPNLSGGGHFYFQLVRAILTHMECVYILYGCLMPIF